MPACIPVQQTLVHMLDVTGLSLRALVQRFKHRAGHLHLAHDLASTRVEGVVGQHPMPQILYSDRGRVCQGPNLFLSSAALILLLHSACLGLAVFVASQIIRQPMAVGYE